MSPQQSRQVQSATGSGKAFKTHGEQINLLRSRGMVIDSDQLVRHLLERVNYYRLSGYWYSWREIGADGARREVFIPGTNLADIDAVYDFDWRLREAVFSALAHIELSVRSMLGHELGRIDPLAHLHPELLGPVAYETKPKPCPSVKYEQWLKRYRKELTGSREDFVMHHNQKYGGQLPIWAAVEVMDWGSLSYLFQLAPIPVRETIAGRVGLNGAQFGSWLKSLNILRNYSAHHARMFNRVYALKPRLPKIGVHPELDAVASVMNRLFGQLTIVQYLLIKLNIGDAALLPSVIASYPILEPLPPSHLGIPENWQQNPLWGIN